MTAELKASGLIIPPEILELPLLLFTIWKSKLSATLRPAERSAPPDDRRKYRNNNSRTQRIPGSLLP